MVLDTVGHVPAQHHAEAEIRHGSEHGEGGDRRPVDAVTRRMQQARNGDRGDRRDERHEPELARQVDRRPANSPH